MSFSEHAFDEQKTKLRIEAMEKEVQRLRATNQKNSGRLISLRRNLYLQLVFFVSLFSILLFKGLIQLPGVETSLAEVTKPVISVDTVYIEKATEDTLSSLVYNTHKAALPKENYDGIIFAIQIGAYAGLDFEEYKDNLLGLKQDTYEGINQFTLGEFVEYNEAETFLETVRQMGFKDAFIMSFKNGRRIQIQNALAMRQKNTSNTQATEQPAEDLLTQNNSGQENKSIAATNTKTHEVMAESLTSDGIQL